MFTITITVAKQNLVLQKIKAIEEENQVEIRSRVRCVSEATGFKTEYSLDSGIEELIKGFTMIKNSLYSNV